MKLPDYDPFYKCGSPENEDYDEVTGEYFCACCRCKARRAKAARDEREIDDYEEDKKGWQ